MLANGSRYAAMRDAAERDPERFWREAAELVGWFRAPRVDPRTAFTAFTDELDLWWVRGPINGYGAGKLLAMRIELGIGGRARGLRPRQR